MGKTPAIVADRQTERFDLRALHETSKLLSSSLDLEFVLNNLLLISMSKLLVTRGLVLLHDPLTRSYRIAAVKGIKGLKQHARLGLDLAAGGRRISGDDIPPELFDHRIEFMLPIISQNSLIGYIGLGGRATGHDHSPDQLEFLQSLVNISSAAIHNSLMVEELKLANRDLDSRIQELNTLFDLSQEFSSTLDRGRLTKLLSFALMGQMVVQKYILLVRQPEGSTPLDGSHPDDLLCLVSARGMSNFNLDIKTQEELSKQSELVYLEGEDISPKWNMFAEQGLRLILPLRTRERTEGLLCLGPKMTGQPYQPGDVEFLSSLGNLALVSLKNAYLVEQQIEKERLEEELRLAREIQERFLPQKLPHISGLETAALALPSLHIAGDYYDVVELTDNRFVFAIADVTGKGLPASLLMANLQACLHVLLPIDISLTDATSLVNSVVHHNTGFDKFITFFWGIYQPSTSTLRYVNAGHNPPLVIRRNGDVELLETGGLLLGIFSKARYEEDVVRLDPGDMIAMFTDGVTEAMSPEEAEYGEKRLVELLLKYRGENAEEILRRVQEDVRHFMHADRWSDDITIIIMKRIEAPGT